MLLRAFTPKRGVTMKFVILTGMRSGGLSRLIPRVLSSTNGIFFDAQYVQQKQVITVN